MANVRQEILVVCLVESSVSLLHEWNDVLLTYMSPLLQRIATAGAGKGSRNELRIGFVSYSDSHVHPNPILARRFFSPVIQLTRELKDDPASLGLGRTASGGRRGMAILEGYVAVFEMFDSVSDTRPPLQPLRPQIQNESQPERPPYDPTYYLIHVASSPPNKATRPLWNTNPALDGITWASLPSELLKRKIRSNMILTRSIPELQELYKHISCTPDPSWISLLKPCHKLLFSGLPPKDTKIIPQKRAATENSENEQQSTPPRPSSREPAVTANPPKAITMSPAVNTPASSSPPRPGGLASVQPPIEPQPQLQLPPAAPFQPSPQPQPPQSRFTAFGQNLDPARLSTYIRAIDNECRAKLATLNQARAVGRPQAEIDVLQTDLNQKAMNRTKLLAYQQIMQRQQASGGGPQATTAQNSQPVSSGQTQLARPTQEQSEVHMTPPNPGSSGQGTQAGPSHAGNVAFTNPGAPNISNKNPFQNIPISMRSSMEVQMQKMLAERNRPSVLATAPQTPPQPPLPPQSSMPSAQGNLASTMNQNQNPPANLAASSSTDNMAPRPPGNYVRRWQGVLAWPSSPVNAGSRKENQLYIVLFSQDNNLRCDPWPQRLTLQPSRCVLNMQQLQGWVKELSPSMGLISSTPIPGNPEATAQNGRLFHQLKELIQAKNLLAYCKFDIPGSPPGTGFVTFPMNSNQGDLLVAMVFHKSPIPAALMGQAPLNQTPPDPGNAVEMSSVPQAMNAGAGSISMQNLSSETKAFLQQRQAAALAAYNQQQLAQQQAQQKGLVPNSGSPAPGPGPGPPAIFNVAQFIQGMQGLPQQTGGENQIGMGGLNLPQAPPLQQVQHRQPQGFNPAQMGSIQNLQFMNRRPDEGQGQ